MSDYGIPWFAHLPEGTTRPLIPDILSTPDMVCEGVIVAGRTTRDLTEATTGQTTLCQGAEVPA